MTPFGWSRKKREKPVEEKEDIQRVEEEFSLQRFIESKPEYVRPFLKDYGGHLNPDFYLKALRDKKDESDTGRENYLLALGTREEVLHYFKKTRPELTQEQVIEIANSLRDLYTQRITMRVGTKARNEAERLALGTFQRLEQEIYN